MCDVTIANARSTVPHQALQSVTGGNDLLDTNIYTVERWQNSKLGNDVSASVAAHSDCESEIHLRALSMIC